MVEKIRKEAYAVYQNDEAPVSDRQFSQLDYAQAVVQEAIRLKPTIPQLFLEANKDIVIEDWFVPKDTKVILHTIGPQNQEKHFSNASQFIPERWLKKGCPFHGKHSPDVMKAFGGGARYCPGKNLAMNEITILTSALCKKFDFSLSVKPDEVKEQYFFTTLPN